MIYFANPCGPEVVEKMTEGVIGFIDTPRQRNHRPENVYWCADNGCFSKRFKEDHWWSFLERHAHDTSLCAFAVAPDVVGDAVATLERSTPWLPRIRELGYPAAFVAQDGIEATPVPWGELDCLFIGGSTEFKLGEQAAALTEQALGLGKWVHMGRVNSAKRMRYAMSIGCDSADGTFLTFGPKVNLPKLLRWPGVGDNGN